MYKLLKDVATYSKDRIDIKSVTIDSYVTTDNLLQDKEGKVRAEKMPAITGKITKYDAGDILIANIRPYLKKIWFADSSGGSSADVLTLKVKVGYNPKFVYYSLFRDDFFTHVMNGSKGTKMPRGDKRQILDFSIPNFPILKQDRIAKVLSDLDAKIDLNNRINLELEGMAKLIYDYWFVQFDFPISEAQAAAMGRPELKGKPYKTSGGTMVFNEELKREVPEGWGVNTLLSVANFTNGIACQKFRPKRGEESLPVIKIREMRDGITDNTERVSLKIPDKCYVEDGDILFSWSASLEVIIWTGGNGGLNQHIFKVTSDTYPNSYVYFVLKDYLKQFQRIAELRKTTMGHITQDHLKQSRICIPPISLIKSINEILEAIFSRSLKAKKENQTLTELRDWLLPMLMNGQVRVMGDEGEVRMAAEPGGEYKTPK